MSLQMSQAQTDFPLSLELDDLQHLIDHAVLGIFRSTIRGRLVMANAALAQIFGFESPEDMLERVTDVGSQLYAEPEQRKAWCKLFQNQKMVGPIVWRGNRTNHELLYLEEYAGVIRDSKGEIVGYEGVVLDVTTRYLHEPGYQGVMKNVPGLEQADTTDNRLSNEQLRDELAKAKQMIATLREQLDRFQIATMGSQEGLWEGRPVPGQPWDSPSTPAWYSAQFSALLGFETHEFPPVLESWASRIHPEDRSRVFEAMRNHIEYQVPYDVESRLKTKQGTYRWFKGKGQGIFNKQGELIRGGGTIRDITDQKEAEDALKREHALLTAVVEGTSDIIFAKDHEGRYLLMNSTGAKLLGRKIEEVIGKTDVELFPMGGHPLFTKNDHDVLREKTSQSFEIDVEDSGVVSRTFLVTKEIFRQTEEGFEGVFGIARDITFRKAAELTIQEREKRYRAIMENASDLILEVDAIGTFLYASPNFEEVLGYAPRTLLGRSIFSFVHSDDYEMVIKEFERMVAVGTGRAVLRYRHQNGGYHWFESTGRVYQTALGGIRGVVVSRDITERKHMEMALRERDQKLQQVQKMEAIGALAGGIAHDFNNILGAILGYSELALTQAKQDTKLVSYLEEVLTAGHRAKELVKQILAFSHQSDQKREAVDLNVIVQESLKMIRATLPSSIEIRSTLTKDSAVVFADPTQMHQVIMNLCANAEYAMREKGGMLHLSVCSFEVSEHSHQAFTELQPGNYLQITIQDSGQGMSGHVLERIFDPFFTTKSLGEGTGLGLAVVHGIIVGHGGHIAASSVIGQGTTFTIFLPRLDVVLSTPVGHSMENLSGSGNVLFVDDEEVLARWGEQALTQLGYSVVTKTNPYEAVELFRRQPDQFDIVITDQTMPTMSGEALAKALLEIRQDIPIVLCTGFSHTMSQEKAEQLGLKEFLMKPVNGALLANTVQQVLKTLDEESNSNI